jgi:hypothetical protein
MGEYAMYHGEKVKIGTCESMYYLRIEQASAVDPLPGNVNPATDTGLFFRLPFPDEDNIEPGSFKDHDRGHRLCHKVQEGNQEYWRDFESESCANHPGITQLRNDSGLLINAPCYHGEKLPTNTGELKCFWNGKSWFYELVHIKRCDDGTYKPVFQCRFCREMWSAELDEILPFVTDRELRLRLETYRNQVSLPSIGITEKSK